MNRRALSTYLAWVVCLVLSLGAQQGPFRLVAVTAVGSNNAAQQAQGSSNSEETHDHLPEQAVAMQQIGGSGGVGPTRGWLVLRAALSTRPIPPKPLAEEDPRHILKPRRSPPPEPDQQRV